jgi:hypothetical protein
LLGFRSDHDIRKKINSRPLQGFFDIAMNLGKLRSKPMTANVIGNDDPDMGGWVTRPIFAHPHREVADIRRESLLLESMIDFESLQVGTHDIQDRREGVSSLADLIIGRGLIGGTVLVTERNKSTAS